MATTIALAGKGGVGKTTIAGMVIKYLSKPRMDQSQRLTPIRQQLDMVLGLDLGWTVGDMQEDMLAQVKQSLSPAMPWDDAGAAQA
jgi:CO dehydrogenase maturation factor